MHMSKKQLLVFIAIVIASILAWVMALKIVLDSTSSLAMLWLVWFFGALFVSTIIIGAWDHLNVKPRHATLS